MQNSDRLTRIISRRIIVIVHWPPSHREPTNTESSFSATCPTGWSDTLAQRTQTYTFSIRLRVPLVIPTPPNKDTVHLTSVSRECFVFILYAFQHRFLVSQSRCVDAVLWHSMFECKTQRSKLKSRRTSVGSATELKITPNRRWRVDVRIDDPIRSIVW